MEKKEGSDGEPSMLSPEVQAFCHLLDRERQRRQLLEERNGRSLGKQLACITTTWQPTFELEDFEMSAENVQSNLDKGTKEERLIFGTKRMRNSTPLFTTEEKKHKTDASRGSGYAFNLNKINESMDDTTKSA